VTVFFRVSLGGLGAMMYGLMRVTMCDVGVMSCFFVVPIPMMLGRFTVVPSGVLVMLRRLGVMLRCLLGHESFLQKNREELPIGGGGCKTYA
jgi:hypothetical protein